jgi:hypothetical protein
VVPGSIPDLKTSMDRSERQVDTFKAQSRGVDASCWSIKIEESVESDTKLLFAEGVSSSMKRKTREGFQRCGKQAGLPLSKSLQSGEDAERLKNPLVER